LIHCSFILFRTSGRKRVWVYSTPGQEWKKKEWEWEFTARQARSERKRSGSGSLQHARPGVKEKGVGVGVYSAPGQEWKKKEWEWEWEFTTHWRIDGTSVFFYILLFIDIYYIIMDCYKKKEFFHYCFIAFPLFMVLYY
jgi:hypothetical protein